MLVKFFKTKNFKELNAIWKEKLKESGFEDIENEHGQITEFNPRSNAFKMRNATEEFYNLLRTYLNTAVIPNRDRAILELYLEGFPVQGAKSIMSETGWSRRTVHYVISHHKVIFLKRH
jgi:hypothetical protein